MRPKYGGCPELPNSSENVSLQITLGKWVLSTFSMRLEQANASGVVKVQGQVLRVWDSGFQGSGFRVWGSKSKSSGLKVQDLEFSTGS